MATKIKLGSRPKSFTRIVKFPMLEGGEGSIECTFKYRTRSEFGVFIDALVESDDGFYLAEVDLELRGEGTLMNKDQKGRTDLKLASLRRDRELVQLARETAYEIVDADPDLADNEELRQELSLFLRPQDEEFLFKS